MTSYAQNHDTPDHIPSQAERERATEVGVSRINIPNDSVSVTTENLKKNSPFNH